MTYNVKFVTGESAVFSNIVELLYVTDRVYDLKLENGFRIRAINVISLVKKR